MRAHTFCLLIPAPKVLFDREITASPGWPGPSRRSAGVTTPSAQAPPPLVQERVSLQSRSCTGTAVVTDVSVTITSCAGSSHGMPIHNFPC